MELKHVCRTVWGENFYPGCQKSVLFLHLNEDLTNLTSRGGRTPSCRLLWNHFSEGTTEGVVENGLRHSSDWGYSA